MGQDRFTGYQSEKATTTQNQKAEDLSKTGNGETQ